MGEVRTFPSGATRDTDAGKLDPEGFLHPAVLRRFCEYMHKHRLQSDGSLRAADNWQRGIPPAELMKSAFRHFLDWWSEHRGCASREGAEDALCGLLFNANAYLLHLLRQRGGAEEAQARPAEENLLSPVPEGGLGTYVDGAFTLSKPYAHGPNDGHAHDWLRLGVTPAFPEEAVCGACGLAYASWAKVVELQKQTAEPPPPPTAWDRLVNALRKPV